MATKLYLTSKSPTTALTGPLLGNWSGGDSYRNARAHFHYVFLLDPDPTLGGRVDPTGAQFGASTTKTANQKLVCNGSGVFVWVTPRLATAGTLTGTVTITMKVSELTSATGGSAFYHLYAYISDGDTLTQRQVAVNNVTDATAWDHNPMWQSMTCAIGGSYQAGDRIVFEIGASASPPSTPPGDTVLSMSWGTTGGPPTYATLADAVHGSFTATAAAWLQFSSTLSFVAVSAPPVNDACADAILIASLPYASTAMDTTGSLDPDKAVWFSWTATATTRVFLTTRGSNYNTMIQVYRGCGGTSVTIPTAAYVEAMWNGRAQAMAYFTPQVGQTYAIKITCDGDAFLGAKQSNGSLSLQMFEYQAPQTDDLFVNCQYIVCFRGQQPVNWLPDFFSYTPTGAAIDYTERPMRNLADGTTHTALRYYCCLFGSLGWIEILDLATLSVGVAEIDTMLELWDGNDNAASVVFDDAGRIVVGWYGNHYDVNGTPATGGTANIRRVDATHGDSQPGAPFPLATSYAAAVEDGGTEFVDLATDQDTIFYTSAGVLIKRWSIAGGQLADFATVPASLSPRPGAHGLRLLPPSGTGADGLLVSVGDRVYRLNAAGAVIQTYIPTPTALAQDLDKVEITHDRLYFWVSDQLSANLFKFNLATGAQVDRIDTGLPPGQLCGFAIYNGYRAGNPPEIVVAPPYAVETRYIRRQRRAPHVNNDHLRVFVRRFELDLERGQGLATGQGSDPIVLLRISRDGGQTWGEEITLHAGALGAYTQRVIARRLGHGRDTVFEVTVSDPIAWSLVGAWLDVEAGSS